MKSPWSCVERLSFLFFFLDKSSKLERKSIAFSPLVGYWGKEKNIIIMGEKKKTAVSVTLSIQYTKRKCKKRAEKGNLSLGWLKTYYSLGGGGVKGRDCNQFLVAETNKKSEISTVIKCTSKVHQKCRKVPQKCPNSPQKSPKSHQFCGVFFFFRFFFKFLLF